MMTTSLDVTFTPADFAALAQQDLRGMVCVVFDVLRATTSMITALAHGADGVLPVEGIAEALAAARTRPGALLAGERHGLRIAAAVSGGVEFDLGNSPREFTPERVAGRLIVMTTTNGTRALRACAGAARVWAGALVNLGALVQRIERERPPHLRLVGSGTLEGAALEDTLAAGALADAVWGWYGEGRVGDGAQMARQLYRAFAADLPAAFRFSRNGQRLLAHPDLREDVGWCAAVDRFRVVPELGADGIMRAGSA